MIRFEGDRIYRLEDHYEPAMKQGISEYLTTHAAKLGIRIE